MLTERTNPTHVLTIEVPLNLSERDHWDFDAVQDAVRICIALSRAASAGYICNEVMVSIKDTQ